MKYIASCSFGKDSIAMILKIISEGLPLDEIVYCKVMYNNEISAEYPEHEYFINNVGKPWVESLGIKFTQIEASVSFEEYAYRKITNGKHKGKLNGFPYIMGAWCNSRLKLSPINKYFKSMGKHFRYIGIAYDEPKRYLRLSENEISPLYDLKITESEAMEICKSSNLLSPAYEYFDRTGCWFCNKNKLQDARTIFTRYPLLWDKLKEMQKDFLINKTLGIYYKKDISVLDLEKRFNLEKQFTRQCKDIKSREFYNQYNAIRYNDTQKKGGF